MSIRITRNEGGSGARARGGMAVALALLLLGSAGAAGARGGACSDTARSQLLGCLAGGRDDLYTARAICTNVSDRAERRECFADSWSENWAAWTLCLEQRQARAELCGQLGEARYDPDVDPLDFQPDPASPTRPNPWYPLAVGNEWVYVGGDETITVRVPGPTKQIQGVTCLVVRDVVDEDGDLVEDTDDWLALRRDGTVDYFGEIARNYEIIDGEGAELVDLEGSWKAGRDGAKSGTLFPGDPSPGQIYRQEWAASSAEDVAMVLSSSYRHGEDPELDEHVPQELAELLCAAGDCVVTRDFTPISPDAFERKYYARGLGAFLEVDPESGDIVQLVACSFDPRCDDLPEP